MHQMDGQYQERYENIRPRRPNDERQEGVVKDGGNGRLTLVNKTRGESESNSAAVQLVAGIWSRNTRDQDYKEKHKLDSKQISNSPC